MNMITAFLAQHVGNSLYGFQGLSSEHPEVLELLAAVTTRIRSCMHVISAQQAVNAMLGFQGMSSSKPEVRNCIAAFAIHLGIWLSAPSSCTLSAHLVSTPSQHNLSTHPLNTIYLLAPPLPSTHSIIDSLV